MEIELDNQPPNCNQTLDNFINRYEAELLGTSQQIKILFLPRGILILKRIIIDLCLPLF